MRARRVPIVDEYSEGDQVAVFVGEQVLVLSVVATAAWEAVGERWTELTDITDEVVAAVGSPPGVDPAEAVTGLLTELHHAGLVEVE